MATTMTLTCNECDSVVNVNMVGHIALCAKCLASAYPMPRLSDALTNACQLLDAAKSDWQAEGCWSEYDQAIRNALSRELNSALEKGL